MSKAPIPFAEALNIVAEAAAAIHRDPPVLENLSLQEARNRVIAAPVLADRDQPPFPRATRDGFAVQASPFTTGATLQVIGQIRAGHRWQGPAVTSGTAIEIMTGAPLPPGADSVVMLEHVTRGPTSIALAPARTLTVGDNVVPQASEAHAGQQLIPAGTRITAAEIALAASCGCTRLPVYPCPKVAIIATGDELVPLDQAPAAHQIRNSNTCALAALVAAAGGHPAPLPIARDTHEDIRERIAQGRMYDLLILSGGVSAGAYDLVEEVLAEFDAQFLFTGVAMQPGKPVVFGRLPARPQQPACSFFGLPGNPVSTQVTFHAFVEPFLRALAGETSPTPRWAQATLAETVPARPGLTRLLPARLEGTRVTLTPWQGSGDLAANARANCYAELLPATAYTPGDILRILLR